MATVIVKSTLLQTFRATSGRNLLFYTGILTVFAAIIATVWSTTTPGSSLPERSWELASLRVLGMTRGEVSVLLFGELAVEILVAIPAGFRRGLLVVAAHHHADDGEAFEIPLVILPPTYLYAGVIVAAAGVVAALIVRNRSTTGPMRSSREMKRGHENRKQDCLVIALRPGRARSVGAAAAAGTGGNYRGDTRALQQTVSDDARRAYATVTLSPRPDRAVSSAFASMQGRGRRRRRRWRSSPRPRPVFWTRAPNANLRERIGATEAQHLRALAEVQKADAQLAQATADRNRDGRSSPAGVLFPRPRANRPNSRCAPRRRRPRPRASWKTRPSTRKRRRGRRWCAIAPRAPAISWAARAGK